MSDGELYWDIKNGVRWSGMPAFGKPGDDDQHAWKIVAYVRHLPKLSPQEQEEVLHQTGEPMDHAEDPRPFSLRCNMLNIIAWFSLGLAFISAIIVAVDEASRPQKMWIMNVVWPVTCLYFSVFALWAYFSAGRGMTKQAMQAMSKEEMRKHQEEGKKQARRSPTWKQTALAASHCGAGCVLADILTEFTVFGVGATLFGIELYASFLWDFLAAWALGIVFQYFTIKPMRDLSVGGGIWAAMKADTLSILTFQIGMYGWMALTFFKFFPHPHLHANEPGYWLMMQIAMICGFVTALPVNRLLVKIGWKEAMG